MGVAVRAALRSGPLPVLLLITAWVYAPSLDGAFVYEDLNDPARFIQPHSWEQTWQFPIRSFTGLTYGLSYALGGGDPWAYRAVSLAWHLLNGCLLWLLIRHARWAWVGLGLFLLHPIQSQAVAYISARADLVMTTCVLLGVWCGGRGWLRSAWLCAVLAVLAKESGVVAFALIPMAAWGQGQRWTWRAHLMWWAPGLLVGAWLLDWLLVGHGLPLSAPYTVAQLAAVWQFIGLTVAPFWLTVDNDPSWFAARAPWALGAWCLLGAVWVLRPAWRVGWMAAWVLVALAPRLVVVLTEGMHEHHWYLPLTGVLLMAAWGTDGWTAVSEDALQRHRVADRARRGGARGGDRRRLVGDADAGARAARDARGGAGGARGA